MISGTYLVCFCGCTVKIDGIHGDDTHARAEEGIEEQENEKVPCSAEIVPHRVVQT